MSTKAEPTCCIFESQDKHSYLTLQTVLKELISKKGLRWQGAWGHGGLQRASSAFTALKFTVRAATDPQVNLASSGKVKALGHHHKPFTDHALTLIS